MSALLLLQDRVRNAIQVGESFNREFKTALEGPPNNKKPRLAKHICKDIAEDLVAFANVYGGELLVGVEDDRTISGVPHSDEEIKELLSDWRKLIPSGSTLPALLQYATTVEIESKTVIFFAISKGTKEIYSLTDGRCLRRSGESSAPLLSIHQIEFERTEVRSREYDREFVDGATVSDLDRALVQSCANNYLVPDVDQYLQQIGLAEYSALGGLRLRRAALILFATDTFRWYLRSEVRIMKVAGTERKSGEHYNVRSDVFITGNVFKLLVDAWNILKNTMVVNTEFGQDARFEQKYIYPEQTCREALINAIVHRDYISQNPIEISIFDDRMEIKSPGALLSTLTIEDLEQLQGDHDSRNVLVARVLRENKYVRELGEGVRRMFEVMEENELDRPKLYSNHHSFSVSLFHKPLFNEKQKKFLAGFSSIPLTTRQKKIVVLGMNGQGISPNDIRKAINTQDSAIYDREVSGLRNSGILIQVKTNANARSYEESNKLPRGSAPRFKVELPIVKTGVPATRQSLNQEPGISVKNLPPSITEAELRDIFEKKCGDVTGVYLAPKDIRPGWARSGVVRFQSNESVKTAIQSLNGTEIRGNRISVEEYKQNP